MEDREDPIEMSCGFGNNALSKYPRNQAKNQLKKYKSFKKI